MFLVFAAGFRSTALGAPVSRGGGGGLVSALSPIGALIRLAPVDRTYDFLYRQAAQHRFWRGVVRPLRGRWRWSTPRARITLLLGRWSRYLQTGRVGDYVYAVVGGLVLLAAWSQVMFWLVR